MLGRGRLESAIRHSPAVISLLPILNSLPINLAECAFLPLPSCLNTQYYMFLPSDLYNCLYPQAVYETMGRWAQTMLKAATPLLHKSKTEVTVVCLCAHIVSMCGYLVSLS